MTTIERGHDYILWAAKYNKRIVLLSTLIISIHGLKLLSKQIVALLTIKGCSPSEAILFSETATKGGMWNHTCQCHWTLGHLAITRSFSFVVV